VISYTKKSEKAYKTIGEVAKELGLVNKKNGKLQTHTLRYWETQFKQIKPTIKAGQRRYYSLETYKIIKRIKYLLKVKGVTINGVKKILNNPITIDYLDENEKIDINNANLNTKKLIKDKIKNISKIIKDLKNLK
tara:strand:+ start:154 stop:558 length:405 start_codon:yes stop_codon:yes gene_type:complete